MINEDIVIGTSPTPYQPAGSAGSRPRWARKLAPLKDQPGVWAKVYSTPKIDTVKRGPHAGNKTDTYGRAKSVRDNLVSGRATGIEAGEFEAIVAEGDGTYEVHVKYVG